jgi:hypothetical protein
MKRYLWILALPVVAAAQFAPVELAAPTLGYVWEDQSHSLRPVEGVPGSATVGGAVNLGTTLERITVAPSRRFALGKEPGAGTLLLLRLDGAIASARQSDLPAGTVTFSPSGEAAAVALVDRVEVWKGMPDQPRRHRSFNSVDLTIQRLAVSDDGNRVLTLSAGSLHRLTPDGGPELIGDGYQDVTFLRQSSDVIAAHTARGVVLLRKTEADSEENIGIVDAPLALAVSSDEGTIAVLSDGFVTLIERASQRVVTLPLDGTVTDSIVRVQGNAVFQLTANADDIWFLDADSATPRLVSVSKGAIQ